MRARVSALLIIATVLMGFWTWREVTIGTRLYNDPGVYNDPGADAVKLAVDDSQNLLPQLSGKDAGSLDHSQSHVPAAEVLAEFTYRNQMMERRHWFVNTLLAKYEAEWPCFWGEEAVGDFATWQKHWDQLKDGWKFVCGLRHIADPCIVYSLGSSGNMAFEVGIMAAQPQCRVHIFDKGAFGLERWFPDEKVRSRVKFHRTYIASHDDLTVNPPQRTLRSIMAELGHKHVDILKADVEGAEFDMFSTPELVPSVAQVLLEVHLVLSHPERDYDQLIRNLEKRNLRLFHKEVNARYDRNCIELAFIQRQWRPWRKNYTISR